MVEAVTEAVLDAEDGAQPRDPMRVWVFPTEMPDGTWGAGGRINRLEDIVGFVMGDQEKARAILQDVTYVEDMNAVAEGCDALVIATEWPEFKKLDLERARKVLTHPILFDGRNLNVQGRARIVQVLVAHDPFFIQALEAADRSGS